MVVTYPLMVCTDMGPSLYLEIDAEWSNSPDSLLKRRVPELYMPGPFCSRASPSVPQLCRSIRLLANAGLTAPRTASASGAGASVPESSEVDGVDTPSGDTMIATACSDANETVLSFKVVPMSNDTPWVSFAATHHWLLRHRTHIQWRAAARRGPFASAL